MKSSGCSKNYLPVLAIFVLAIIGSSMFSTVFATMNTTFLRANSSLEEERHQVEKDLVALVRKAISLDADMIEFGSSFDQNNASLYITVHVNSSGGQAVNVSEFPIEYYYDEDKPGSVGVGLTFAKDLGVIVRIPEGKYHMVPTNSTNNPDRDPIINSYSTSFSEGCSGDIHWGESKDCIIYKCIYVPRPSDIQNPKRCI
jgi:hypothetical protein